MSTDTITEAPARPRQLSVRTVLAAYAGGVVLCAVASAAYHHFAHDRGVDSFGYDVVFYAISGLVGVLVALLALFRVSRARRPLTTPRTGVVLGALGVLVFPVAYYMPLTFIWGSTAMLLSADSVPGRSRTAARVLGGLALVCAVGWAVYRLAGGTFQVGG